MRKPIDRVDCDPCGESFYVEAKTGVGSLSCPFCGEEKALNALYDVGEVSY